MMFTAKNIINLYSKKYPIEISEWVASILIELEKEKIVVVEEQTNYGIGFAFINPYKVDEFIKNRKNKKNPSFVIKEHELNIPLIKSFLRDDSITINYFETDNQELHNLLLNFPNSLDVKVHWSNDRGLLLEENNDFFTKFDKWKDFVIHTYNTKSSILIGLKTDLINEYILKTINLNNMDDIFEKEKSIFKVFFTIQADKIFIKQNFFIEDKNLIKAENKITSYLNKLIDNKDYKTFLNILEMYIKVDNNRKYSLADSFPAIDEMIASILSDKSKKEDFLNNVNLMKNKDLSLLINTYQGIVENKELIKFKVKITQEITFDVSELNTYKIYDDLEIVEDDISIVIENDILTISNSLNFKNITPNMLVNEAIGFLMNNNKIPKSLTSYLREKDLSLMLSEKDVVKNKNKI